VQLASRLREGSATADRVFRGQQTTAWLSIIVMHHVGISTSPTAAGMSHTSAAIMQRFAEYSASGIIFRR